VFLYCRKFGSIFYTALGGDGLMHERLYYYGKVTKDIRTRDEIGFSWA
jgi:hypothetical protein